MLQQKIEVPVRIDSTAFQEFALFDTFRLRKRWRNPVLFAVILAAFACVCFAMNDGVNQAPLLGGVLLLVGLLLPLTYFFNFFHSVKDQAKKMGLENVRHVYTVILTQDGITHRTATNPPQVTVTPWDKAYGAWRTAYSIYLYVDMNHAYLMPAGQGSCSDDEIWACLQEKLGADKCHKTK